MEPDRKAHWKSVYETKDPDQVSMEKAYNSIPARQGRELFIKIKT